MRISDFPKYRVKPSDNVFVFVCADDFLVEESRRIWVELFAGNWLVEKLHVKEFEGLEFGRLMDDALTPSLFAQSRLLMVTSAEKSTKGRIEELAKLQEVTSSSLKIILNFGSLKAADSWTRVFPIIQIDPLNSADSVRWVVERYGLAPDLARYLVESIGPDLYPLHNEVQKLQTFAGSGKALTTRDVDELILRSERFGTFELDDALIAKDYLKCVQVAGAMLGDGMEPLVVLSRILRVWRQLFIGKGAASQRNAKEVAAIAGVPPFKAGEFLAGCRKYDWKQLASGFRELLNLDRTLKSSSADTEACFDVMLWKLTN